MKVKASMTNIRLDNSNFKYEISTGMSIDDSVLFEGIFKIPENVRIDFSKLREVIMEVPIINELEKYSVNELKEELLRREKEFPKSFIFCCRCKEPIFTKPVLCRFNQTWYYCPSCKEKVLAAKLPE